MYICTSYISEPPKKSLTPAVGVCAVIPASHALMSQAVMKKSRPIKRAEAGVPTGKIKPSKQLGRFNRNLQRKLREEATNFCRPSSEL